ncbi:hypothetical protein CXG81DRAFT_13355 [Caulochytrium protostelioides]|uniref:WD40 repeat-like protein n=1 Tax=Caulochytrium protostelioides TaxID=1555241 RepID=A0A4P9X5G1_9FUNG|nr:WD40 repeat-like protein [Caulochytrium protostelioides]RKP00342.1 hypothetical protein CXG81DRAFT_13355 [Caulochytrium protostelioides]|eukprot:RKP00342.1 hypothetical protein CXG81DRAFT_13355 [Caulochytrium protostelioides]
MAPVDETRRAYQEEVGRALGVSLDRRILAFHAEAPAPSKARLVTDWSRPLRPAARPRRTITTVPDKVLDAPGLVDDYYLNLLDWSCHNVLGVGLDRTVYLWNATTADVCELMTVPDSDGITSLRFSADGGFLAVGLHSGDTQIWDVAGRRKVRSMLGHAARVGVLAWDRHILSSGCRDGSIWHHDVRIARHKTAELLAHTAEVCGLTWRSDGGMLASGGNDNMVYLWDARTTAAPAFARSDHTAAVKALAWCPWELHLLASGGGSHDRMLHFWNASTGQRLSSIDTGSQVTSITWSRHYKELLTTHGFPDNHLSIWNYVRQSKVVDLPGHDARVLHAAQSPDGQVVATGAADENINFWKAFEYTGDKSKRAGAAGATRAASALAHGGGNTGSNGGDGSAADGGGSHALMANRMTIR